MRYLLDTNAYVAFLRGHPGIVRLVRSAEYLGLSAIVMGELLFGFRAGSRFARNLAELEDFLDNPRVVFLPVTAVTADRFGRIAALLKRQGTPVPSNDMWIAAHTMETGAALVTFDGHFANVDGLVLADV